MARLGRTVSGLFAVILGLFSSNAQASGLVLASDMQGKVTLHGKPVPGVEVHRHLRWHWNDEDVVQTSVTDAGGKFQFDAVHGSGFLARVLPHEPVIAQLVTIHLKGAEYRLWQHVKHNYDLNGEAGRRLDMDCELSDPDTYKVLSELLKTGYKGVCRLR